MGAVDIRSGLALNDLQAVLRSLSDFAAGVDKRAAGSARAKYVAASVGHLTEFVQRIFPAALVPLAAIAVKAAIAAGAAEAARRAVARATNDISPRDFGSIDLTDDACTRAALSYLVDRQTA